MVGMLVINLIERCSNVVAASSKRNNNNSRRNAAHSLAMSELLREASELRSTLLSNANYFGTYLYCISLANVDVHRRALTSYI
eukprot:scaffold48379_cov55-Attheya_sp.AAC.3